MSEPIREANLHAALAAAIMASGDVHKDASNDFHRYRYASAEAVLGEARAALGAHGLSLIPIASRLVAEKAELGDEKWIDYTLEVTVRLCHSSGEFMDITREWPVIPEKGRPLDKALAGADTTALAYLCRDLLLLPRVEEEVDTRDDRGSGGRRVHRDPVADRDAKPANSEPAFRAADRKALAARASKLPGSPSREAVIRDLANPHLSPDMFAEAMWWVVEQEAELAELRRQGESLKRPTEPTAGAAPSPPPKSPAILTSPAPLSPGAGGVGASTPEQDEVDEVEAAVERAKERRAALAKQAAEGSLRAQLELAQQAGIVPPKEPIPDPGAQPARRRTQRGKAVTPEGVAEELAQAMDPTARLRQVTGDGEAW